MKAQMLAARLYQAGHPLRLEHMPVPEPGAGELLVRVSACGLCGTDLHLAVDGDLPVERTPVTLGHEAAGVVVAVGTGAAGFDAGDRVALFPAATCGMCRFCAVGRESLCERGNVYGMGCDGALAEYVVAPARAVIPLPEAIPFDVGAVVTDGVATPFHALRRRGRLQAGETIAVIGCGGLGTHAILLARMMGAACVVAVDPQPQARERARELGADLVLDAADPQAVKRLRAELGRPGVDLAIELVGRRDSAELALRLLDVGGRAVLVGVGAERPVLPPLVAFVGREQSVLGSFGMDRADIVDLFALVAGGRLDLSRSVSARYPLAEVNEALQALARKDTAVVRLVVEP